jgi:lipoprotein-anchoring transpeptidase ErfK/SrfK
MENTSVKLNNLRQTAMVFALLCVTVATMAVAAPVFAAGNSPAATLPAIVAEAPTVAPQAAIPAAPAPAPAPKKDEEAEIMEKASLKPGDFVWRENASSIVGAPRLLVSIMDQRAYLYRGDAMVAVTTVSTGRKGHTTPTGTFRITEKRAVHFSNKYDNAPMPHMQRLTNDGIALHAGHIPGRPASHGCVRLPAKFAAALFKVTRVGTPVTIVQGSVSAA